MKVAVVTPLQKTTAAWLEKCLASVSRQTATCTHFLVCDAKADLPMLPSKVQVIRLPAPGDEYGNAGRAVGSVAAIAAGFDAIAYLDTDHWYEPDHIQLCCEAHQCSGAPVCSSRRTLYDLNEELLGHCPEVDGKNFVDANCLFLTEKAFGIVALWYLTPGSGTGFKDHIVWKAIRDARLKRVHVNRATVNFRTPHRVHYLHFGKEPPEQCKQITAPILTAPRPIPSQPEALYRWEDRLPSTPLAPPISTAIEATACEGPPPTISLCLIARNEEATIQKCLRSVADLVSNMIVVDTGSTDRTRELAVACGAKVFDFPWIDDFSAARNESLRLAGSEWILWLDADEYFDEENRQRLKRLFRLLREDNRVYMMKQWSLPEQEGASALVVDHARLFRKQPGVAWRFRIHEQILPSLREVGAKVVFTDIVLRHAGYQERAVRGRKLERNLRLLHLEHQENPDEAFTLFNLGGTYIDAGDPKAALTYLRQCVQKAHKGATFLPKTYVLLAQVERGLGNLDQGLRYCLEGKTRFPKDVELWFEEGLLRLDKKDRTGAQRCFEQILKLPPRPCFVGVSAGLRGHITRHQLALIYRDQKKLAEAEAQWRVAVQESPRFGPAWLGLLEACLGQNHCTEAEQITDELGHNPARKSICAALQARLSLSRGDFEAACRIMQQAIANDPRHLWLRLLYAEMLLREGKDPKETKRQLEEVLAIDPKQKWACQRLQELRRKPEPVAVPAGAS